MGDFIVGGENMRASTPQMDVWRNNAEGIFHQPCFLRRYEPYQVQRV